MKRRLLIFKPQIDDFDRPEKLKHAGHCGHGGLAAKVGEADE